MVEIEKKKKSCTDMHKFFIMSAVLSELTVIRKTIFDYMNNHTTIHEGRPSILSNISPKLQKLLDILLNITVNDTCLVFVDRRTTAKILYHYIKV